MVKLTKLRIDEISSVDKGAGDGCRVVLWKRHDDTPPRQLGPMFNDIMLRKAEDDNEEPRTNAINNNSNNNDTKLNTMVDAMVTAAPSLDRQAAAHFLLHTARGRRLAEHLNSILKHKEEPMPQVDIMKLHNIASVREVAKQISADGNAAGISEYDFTSIVMGHARLSKRAGESDGAAFERVLTASENGELRQAYQITKGMASLEPTSVGVGNTSVSDDSAEAVRLLREMAERQHRTFEQVFADPANAALAKQTYTKHHRSSANG
jgi:hypothetical protein